MSTKTQSAPATQPESANGCAGGESPFPPATKEHAWLKRFVGDWKSDVEMVMDPAQPPMKTQGSERLAMFGDYWLLSEGKNDSFPYAFRLTLGFDAQKGKYVGTWIDTMAGYLWTYEGGVDATGDRLTLETEGPWPGSPEKRVKFREVTQFKGNDLRVFTSSRLEGDTWVTHLTVTARRVK